MIVMCVCDKAGCVHMYEEGCIHHVRVTLDAIWEKVTGELNLSFSRSSPANYFYRTDPNTYREVNNRKLLMERPCVQLARVRYLRKNTQDP